MNIARIIPYLFSFQLLFCYNSFSQKVAKAIVRDTTFTGCILAVENPATFLGGSEELQRFLNKNFIYPPEAIVDNYGGKTVFKILIDRDGNVMQPKLMEGNCLYYGLGEEALRVVSKMPKWKPAERNGRRINYIILLQIVFSVRLSVPLITLTLNNHLLNIDSSCNKILFW